jgi:hypothetical protein
MSEQWYTRWTTCEKHRMVPNSEEPFHPRVKKKDSSFGGDFLFTRNIRLLIPHLAGCRGGHRTA